MNSFDLKCIADMDEFVSMYPKVHTIKCNDEVLKYFKAQSPVAVAAMMLYDDIANKSTNNEVFLYESDEYTWDSRYVYYYERYGMPLNDDFIEYALSR